MLNKILISLSLFVIMFQSTNKRTIVIIGEAYNEKDGAWVISNVTKKTYFVAGIDSWDEKTVGENVKVWGKLLIENHLAIASKPGIPVAQQMVGIKKTILNAKWKLVK